MKENFSKIREPKFKVRTTPLDPAVEQEILKKIRELEEVMNKTHGGRMTLEHMENLVVTI